MAGEVVCEYGTGAGGACENSQREVLGYCPDRVRVLCAAAFSERVMNGGHSTPCWRIAQLLQSDQPMIGSGSQEQA